jgi:hypothetical protein
MTDLFTQRPAGKCRLFGGWTPATVGDFDQVDTKVAR